MKVYVRVQIITPGQPGVKESILEDEDHGHIGQLVLSTIARGRTIQFMPLPATDMENSNV